MDKAMRVQGARKWLFSLVKYANLLQSCRKLSNISGCLVLQNLKRVHYKHNKRYVEREDNRTKQQG